jgi:outer membrane lipoprotein carrier protein
MERQGLATRSLRRATGHVENAVTARKSVPRLIAAALSLAWVSQARADVGAVVDAVEKKYEGVSGLQADFTQTVKSAIYGDDTQSGKVTLKRPGKMRWDFAGDGKQFVTDGRFMWIYNAADKQVIRYPNAGEQAGSAQSLLTSLDRIGDLFAISELPDTAGHTLLLAPKTADAQFQDVQLHLDSSLVLEKVVITDTFGTITEIAFHQVTLDRPAPDDLFVFQVPPGVELIDAGSP